MDDIGKLAHGAAAPFNRIANRMPGLETCLPLMFSAMAPKDRMGMFLKDVLDHALTSDDAGEPIYVRLLYEPNIGYFW